MANLTQKDLVDLVTRVFPSLPNDKKLALLVDVPNLPEKDSANWRKRRFLTRQWCDYLQKGLDSLHLDAAELIAYPSVESNNANFPDTGFILDSKVPDLSRQLTGNQISFKKIFSDFQLFMAPTQFSTTAPLKVAARQYGFRAATMPGFTTAMIPALQIDYTLVDERCRLMKEKLDDAIAAQVEFGIDNDTQYPITFDLRYRDAHASSGRFPEPGTAGNLPSGESYIVPYEGEKEPASKTNGTLPVQFNDEVVLFEIKENKAVAVKSRGPESEKQVRLLRDEPAYGNMAELGFGILADFGLHPIGEMLLDEKLAFHIAFGRSDHFGGIVGPEQFSSPKSVVHIDRIYLPSIQNRVKINRLDLVDQDNRIETIISDNRYSIF